MADFNKYFKTLMAHEGGFVNDPVDKGGATKYGITLKTWISKGYDKTGDKKIDINDLRIITIEDAEKIAKEIYWDSINGDQINNQSIAEFLFDWGYNSGVSTASKKLQSILDLNTDGQIGPKTLAKLNSSDQKQVFDKLVASRLAFVESIVKNNPSQVKYLRGWKNRINSFKFGN